MNGLNMFYGKWGAVPFALSTLTSGDSFLVLFHIIRHSKQAISNQPVKMSKRILAKLIGRSRNYLDSILIKLEKLNLITINGSERELLSFVINWEEIFLVSQFVSQINDEGWVSVRDHCLKEQITPFSKLSAETLEKITQMYKFEAGSCGEPDEDNVFLSGSPHEPETISLAHPMSQITASGSPREPADEHLAHHVSQHIQTCSKNEHVSDEIVTDWMNYGNKYKQTPFLAGSPHEPDANNLAHHMSQTPPQSGSPREHSIDIYKDNNKDEVKWNKNIKKNYDKDDFCLNWALERDLKKYDKLPDSEFENILNNPNFYSSPEDILLREVWRDLMGLKDSDEENSQDESFLVPVSVFRELLFRVMEELKEQLPDFNISEEQAKNMFGFELKTINEEHLFVITSSSIKNISSVQPQRQRKGKNRAIERAKNIVFMDCLEELGDADLDGLTSLEYAILLLKDYLKEQTKNNVPHPEEITKFSYQELIRKLAKEANMPEDDLKRLWKDFPVKGNKVYLHLQQLIVDNVWAYNHERKESDRLEIMWKEKYGSC